MSIDLTHARIVEDLIDRIRELEAKQQRAAKVCAELYQVIGSLAGDLGVLHHPKVVKALDNASANDMVHDDVLPFPSLAPTASAEPVAWVAADTLHSPHPRCVSSLAYVSQIDQDRGREYVPLYAAPVAAQAQAANADALAELVHAMFRSGNSVPVERITITRAQYDAAMQHASGGDHG